MKSFWGGRNFINEIVLRSTNENVLRLEISWGFLILGFPNFAPIEGHNEGVKIFIFDLGLNFFFKTIKLAHFDALTFSKS